MYNNKQELIITEMIRQIIQIIQMGACVGKKEPSNQTLLQHVNGQNQLQLKWDNKRSDHDAKQSSKMSSRVKQDRSALTRPQQVWHQSKQEERVQASHLQSVVQAFRSAPQPALQSQKKQSKNQSRNDHLQPQQPINEQQHLEFINRVNPLNIAIVVS